MLPASIQRNPDWTRDETILALDVVLSTWPKLPLKHSKRVQELSDVIRSLPEHATAEKNDRFRNMDGVYMTLQNLASLHPDRSAQRRRHTSRVDRAVWNTFWNRPHDVNLIAEQIRAGIRLVKDALPLETVDPFEAIEGSVLARVHLLRERQRGFRPRVLRRVQAQHGLILCEACNVCVARDDDLVASAMFEVHHVVPLAQVVTTVTRLSDLVLLCANCHRLLHALMRMKAGHVNLPEFQDWLATVPSLSSQEPA